MCAAAEERQESAAGQPRRGSSRKSKDAIAPARPDDVEIRDLSREETEAIIQRNRVGRLAFSFHDRVDIQPIHYIYERGWLYGRTSEGEKISALKHNQWIAFEIDEVADDVKHVLQQHYPQYHDTALKSAIVKQTRYAQQRKLLELYDYHACAGDERAALGAKADQVVRISAKPIYVFQADKPAGYPP